MSIYVNLLRPDEVRRHKAVGKKFTIIASVAGGGSIALLLVLMMLIQSVNAKRTLNNYQQRWQEVEADYQTAMVLRQDLNTNQNLLNELNRWSNATLGWHRVMEELRTLVPSNIQLTRLEVRGSFEAQTDNGEINGPASRRFKIGIFGKAVDEYADDVVLDFIRNVQDSPVFDETLESIKLVGMQVDSAARDELGRTFSIEAITKPRELK